MTILKRRKMIDGQLQPAGVINDKLLDGFLTIDRMEFVDGDDQQKRCYSDQSLISGDGRAFLPPVAAGLLLQNAMLGMDDKVLVIGGGHGYECNILAKINIGVVAVESMRDKIKKNILKNNFYVVEAENDDITAGHPALAPYKAIIIFGLLANLPEKLLGQLQGDGHLLTVLLDKNSPNEKNKIGNLVRVDKDKKITYFGQANGLPMMPEFIKQNPKPNRATDGKTINRMAS